MSQKILAQVLVVTTMRFHCSGIWFLHLKCLICERSCYRTTLWSFQSFSLDCECEIAVPYSHSVLRIYHSHQLCVFLASHGGTTACHCLTSLGDLWQWVHLRWDIFFQFKCCALDGCVATFRVFILVHPNLRIWLALCLLPSPGRIQVLALGIPICCFLQRLGFLWNPFSSGGIEAFYPGLVFFLRLHASRTEAITQGWSAEKSLLFLFSWTQAF